MGEFGLKLNDHAIHIDSNKTVIMIDGIETDMKKDWKQEFGNGIVISNAVNGRNYDITLVTPDITITFIRKVYLVAGYDPQYHFDYVVETFKENPEMHGYE